MNPFLRMMMGISPPEPETISDRPGRGWFGDVLLWWLAMALGPVLLFWHSHTQWNPDGAYAYGWIVPLLTACLMGSRWMDRPDPSAPVTAADRCLPFLAVLTFPALWLQEAAPERGLFTWIPAFTLVSLPLVLLLRTGGRSWLRWFSLPLLFILTSVPWPHTVETLFTNYLMHGTAATTVEILCLLGLPCVLSGNLVQIETGILDIDEACSGIRSLQAMVMIGLFLGELFRLHPWRRVFLLVLGLAVTLAANVVRTTVLASIGIHEGMEAVDRYHDAAGLTVLLFSLSITLIVAQLLRPANLSAPASSSKRTVSLPPLPLQVCAAFLLWFLAGEVLVEAWYRVREPRWQGWSWSVQWPNQNPTFQVNKIPDRSLRLLMCDASESARWTESDGGEWSAYWIRWNPGNAAAATARVHRPEVCLNAEGAVLEKDRGLQPLAVDQLQLPFHAYIFRLRQRVLHVFFCLYEEIPGSFEPERYAPDGMIHLILRAFQGRRNVGQQSLEVALSGYPSDQAAQKVFQTRIRQYLRTGKTAD